MQILRRAINKIHPDNRGASMVSVLITIAFLLILTSVLLFMAYTGYIVKVAQAVGENRFYDAETAMDEVRAGLQVLVSESIAAAYSNVLTGFTGEGDIDKAFTEEFGYVFLISERIDDPDDPLAVGEPLFNLPVPRPLVRDLFRPPLVVVPGYDPIQGVEFNLAFLQKFISDPYAVLSIADSPAATTGSVSIRGRWVDEDRNPIAGAPSGTDMFLVDTMTIQGLRVTHDSPDGYHSIVDSDIGFGMPDLSYARSLFSFRGISNFAFIATEIMRSTGADISVEGSAYFGGINLTEAGFPVTFRGGTFISGGDGSDPARPWVNGDVTVVGRDLIVEDTASLWARNIIVGSRTGTPTGTNLPGNVSFLGNTYAAGSLMLEGDRSSATLAGRYYGFGVGTDSGIFPEVPDPAFVPGIAHSSSILVNSRENKLDLSDLNLLSLAGHSFINTSMTGFEILTGQSMAVRADQLAYLIPVSLIENMTANPTIVPRTGEGSDPEPQINYEAPLWGMTGTGAHRLSRYLDPNNDNGIQIVRRPLVGIGVEEDIYYVFMKFTGPYNGRTAIENANLYFKEYFERNAATNPTEVQAYLNLYLGGDGGGDEVSYAQARMTESAGLTYTINHLGTFGINSSATYNPQNAARYANEYANRRRTLSREYIPPSVYNFAGRPENPFHYVVKEPPPAGLYSFGGTVRAIVNGTPDSYNDTSFAVLAGMPGVDIEDIKIIISYGDITVNLPGFKGLILCDGNIYVNADIESGRNELYHALRAINPSDGSTRPDGSLRTLGDYLNIQMTEESSDEATDAWDFNELVYYDNWKKS